MANGTAPSLARPVVAPSTRTSTHKSGVAATAAVTLEETGDGFSITAVHLDLTARIPGASQQAFETAAENAKAGCPVSKVLNAKITLDKKLEA